MKPLPTRRDFLKMAAVAPVGLGFPHLLQLKAAQPAAAGGKNVLVIVFDTLSAYHLPIYGYPRSTTPNLTRLSERAIVYHKHYAASSFTTPGTASLLTGTLPWKHRAFQLNRTVAPSVVNNNIFRAFESYHRVVYSHNPLVNTLFDQFAESLDIYVPWSRLMLTTDGAIQTLFAGDQDIADVAWTRTAKKAEEGYAYSLFLSELYGHYVDGKIAGLRPDYPLGLPRIIGDNYFRLEDAVDWLESEIGRLPQPYLGYFHFMPPHGPSATHRDFFRAFARDGYQPQAKPPDVFARKLLTEPELERKRTAYDEFILYVDRECGRLFDYLEASGMLENTWVVLTSDHGELFERGFHGHVTPMLYQAVVRVPLVIFEPGRTARTDVKVPTSAADLLPTLLHVAGQPAAGWTEGHLLPPFAAADDARPVFALYAKGNEPNAPLSHATAMMVRGGHKLTYYFGFDELGDDGERIELYDVESDPEELRNLFTAQDEAGAELLAELKDKLSEVNKPYYLPG